MNRAAAIGTILGVLTVLVFAQSVSHVNTVDNQLVKTNSTIGAELSLSNALTGEVLHAGPTGLSVTPVDPSYGSTFWNYVVLTNGALLKFDLISLYSTGGASRMLRTDGNLGAEMGALPSGYVAAWPATQTNAVSGAVDLKHLTNGVDGLDFTVKVIFFNGSGSDQTLTLPVISGGANGWRTNALSAVPPAITNDTIVTMYLDVLGATDTAARQTNVQIIGFSYNQ